MTFDEAYKTIKRGDLVVLRRELEDGLSPDLRNRYSWTILMIAAMKGNTEIGRLLIDKGAELETRNMFRETALSLAVQTGHSSFVKLLLKSGASLDCHPHGMSLDVFLNWVENYCAHPKGSMENIRELFNAERQSRAESPNEPSERDVKTAVMNRATALQPQEKEPT
jgi:ankyrin repeat protein